MGSDIIFLTLYSVLGIVQNSGEKSTAHIKFPNYLHMQTWKLHLACSKAL